MNNNKYDKRNVYGYAQPRPYRNGLTWRVGA
jgi:hypothetical protein